MHEIAEWPGVCTCCLEWYPDLRRWKVCVIPGALELLWICQPCRNLGREEVDRRVNWNIDHLPDGWDDGCPGFAPSSQELGAARARRSRSQGRRRRHG